MNPLAPQASIAQKTSEISPISIGLCLALACLMVASSAAPATHAPRDWRHRIPASAFQKTAPGEWTSPLVQPAFGFDELIYSWHLHQPGDTFRLYLKVVFGPSDQTDWLHAGFWGAVTDAITNRQRPTFERGVLDMDFLKLTAKATGFRFKVVAAGTNALAAAPALTVVATDNQAKASAPRVEPERLPGRVLDVPLRRQLDSQGQWMKDRCQSAALASAMEYYGKSVLLEDIVRLTNDPEYNYAGIWPRVIGAAQEFGYEGYIERFRNWTAVRRALAENKIVLCSIRLKPGDCESPPYASMGDHIVALCGVTDDGRVVVTDSALDRSGRGHLYQWLQSDFETVWMRTKGGVAMVICPPAGTVARRVTDLPPFPKDRVFPAGDDH
ncbi:MAG: C39 family peptidase [Verrucomicrobia bacterium]|jgi:hypothetical protein|nr:C39 family peptidase [Verrucomicrobiota bacterium]